MEGGSCVIGDLSLSKKWIDSIVTGKAKVGALKRRLQRASLSINYITPG